MRKFTTVAIKRLVMFLWRVAWWLLPRTAVILAIWFAVTFGGLFHQEFGWINGIASWVVIWIAIDYYKWHTTRYET